MTATATHPLLETLGDALSSVFIPRSSEEAETLFYALPCVGGVSRNVVTETGNLSAESVLSCHERRTLVLLNTVGRAQAMYQDLHRLMDASRNRSRLILLHSRFFKDDRKAKEELVRSLFGRGAEGPAILVATQVVEAGLDLSCEHLHTELCPMNALVQRAGRCARFAGDSGTVHVYPLPGDERAWLPYGDLVREDSTLTRTRKFLEGVFRDTLHPRQSAEWVQEVHGSDDELALREGWRGRLRECLRRIEQSAILRDPKRVADLIRGEDTDTIRVIISQEPRLPLRPGDREGLSLSRWSLSRLFREQQHSPGWYWDGDEEQPWKPLRTAEGLRRAYVVCLQPAVAAYDCDLGLRLGVAGVQESPLRVEPRSPGHAPLRAESWANHARLVAADAQRRLERDEWDHGLLFTGFERRYGLVPAAVGEMVRTCAILHDLGKLREDWQRWAEAAQKAANSDYQHGEPLAHTDFDPEMMKHPERIRVVGVRRPPHASASAYYARAFLPWFLARVPQEQRAYVASACAAAIVAHHGGWWSSDLDLNPPKLSSNWRTAVISTLGWVPDAEALDSLTKYETGRLLKATTDADSLFEWWPLVAFLTRALRLSDQRATAEGAASDE
jgi:CRISPR-associated endonuclease/helicase Cas3